ncbi:DNA-binding protein [Labilibaculum filiforme]|uniref:DNA-binding protein n=1 Tax=Labilibaculum filiforme TaxID=1940526 RepID=A0A2N3I109_9BACT|nr:DNA-binding protein [Labilibaculum filiforme]
MRKVVEPPRFKGYRPFGVNSKSRKSIDLLYEEYEALKLADYDFLKHNEAAELMGISRPTFARIYESARRKIAAALVEAKEIKTVYGNAVMDKDWYLCSKCNARFNIPATMEKEICPACNSKNIELINK